MVLANVILRRYVFSLVCGLGMGLYIFFGMSLSMHFFLHKGFSALHWAVDGGHIDVVQYALSEGVPVSHMGTCIASKCLTLG